MSNCEPETQPLNRGRLIRLCALGAGLLNAMALGVWFVGDWRTLALVGGPPIPPSVALALFSLSAALLPWSRRNSVAYSVSAIAAAFVAIVAAAGVALDHLLELGFSLDTLLSRGSASHRELAQMPALSSYLLLMMGWALLTSMPSVRERRRYRFSGIGAIFVSMTLCVAAMLHYASTPGSLLHLASPPAALIVVASVLLLGCALAIAHEVDAALRSAFPKKKPASADGRRRDAYAWFVISSTVGVVVVLSYSFLSLQRDRLTRAVEAQLAAFVESQANSVSRWHHGAEAEIDVLGEFFASPSFTALLADESPGATERLLARLSEIEFHGRYGRMVLVDEAGVPLLRGTDGLPSVMLGRLIDSVRRGARRASEGFSTPDNNLHLVHVLPLRALPDAAPKHYVVIDLDATATVLEMMQNSAAGAYLPPYRPHLWWSEGNRLVSVGSPRMAPPLAPAHYRRNAPLFEYPSSEGSRYGLSRRAGDTPWVLAASVSSANEDLRMRRQAAVLAVSLLALFGLVAYFVNSHTRRREMVEERARLREDLERARLSERLGLVMRYANDAIFILGPDCRIVEANERAQALYGRPISGLRGEAFARLQADPAAQGALESATTADGGVYETHHVRADGVSFPVEVSARMVRVAGDEQIFVVTRDITERTERDRRLASLGRLHQMLHRLNEAIPRASSRQNLYRSVGQTLSGGDLTLAWVAVTNNARDRLETVVVAGSGASFVNDRSMSLSDPACLAATAFASGRIAVCNDYPSLNCEHGWHVATRQAGLMSAVAIPLKEDKRIVGVVMVCAGERGYFGDPEAALMQGVADNLAFALSSLSQDESRRATELELQKLSLVVAQLPLSVLITDLQGNIEYVNPCFTSVTGYSAEEAIGRNSSILSSGLTPPAVIAQMWATLAKGERWRGEFINKKKNGEHFIESATIAPVINEAGAPIFYVAIKEDITESKRIAEALRESRRKLLTAERAALQKFNAELEEQVSARTAELAARNQEVQGLLQSIPDMVMRLDAGGRILHSQRAQGTSALASVVIPAAGDAAADTLMALVRAAGAEALAGGTVINREGSIRVGNADVVVDIRTAPVGANEYVAFVRDITERHTLQVNMERALSKEREASAMKSRFISVTSHEFRTPLAAALGSVDLLANHMDRLAPERRRAALVRIRESLVNMEDLVQEILTLSRAESGRIRVSTDETDLVVLANEVVEEARAADRDSHEIVVSGAPDRVVTDRNLLRHIVSNLIGNALRYSAAGTRVEVSLHSTPDSFRIAVSDRGIGVPAADQERIFEPFERGANVGTIRGTGLGLNIVRRMADLLGGHITLCSEENVGSTFAVVFPQPPPEREPVAPVSGVA